MLYAGFELGFGEEEVEVFVLLREWIGGIFIGRLFYACLRSNKRLSIVQWDCCVEGLDVRCGDAADWIA